MADFRGIVKDLVWQFAYRGNDHSGKWLSTGGLLALQNAFKELGWDDPYYVEGGGCEHPGCKAWATCGTPTPSGYKRLCREHFRNHTYYWLRVFLFLAREKQREVHGFEEMQC